MMPLLLAHLEPSTPQTEPSVAQLGTTRHQAGMSHLISCVLFSAQYPIIFDMYWERLPCKDPEMLRGLSGLPELQITTAILVISTVITSCCQKTTCSWN